MLSNNHMLYYRSIRWLKILNLYILKYMRLFNNKYCCKLKTQVGLTLIALFELWDSHQVRVTSDSSALLSRVWRQRNVKPQMYRSQVWRSGRSCLDVRPSRYILRTLPEADFQTFNLLGALARSDLLLLFCSSQRNCRYRQTFTGVRNWSFFPKKQIDYRLSRALPDINQANIIYDNINDFDFNLSQRIFVSMFTTYDLNIRNVCASKC